MDEIINELSSILKKIKYTNTTELCRRVNNRKMRCYCKHYVNTRQKEKGQMIDECKVNFPIIKNRLNKMLYSGEVFCIRARYYDGGQNRKWDVMTVWYYHDKSIWDNPHQLKDFLPHPMFMNKDSKKTKSLIDFI